MAIFDMGAETVKNLNRQTDSANPDFGALVRRFVDAVTLLGGRFSGAGKAAFDNFKNRSALVASELNTALAGIVQDQGGMNTAFQQGDLAASDNARQSEGSANFDGARFRAGPSLLFVLGRRFRLAAEFCCSIYEMEWEPRRLC